MQIYLHDGITNFPTARGNIIMTQVNYPWLILRGHKYSDASSIERWQLIYGRIFALELQSPMKSYLRRREDELHLSIYSFIAAARIKLFSTRATHFPQPTWLSESTKTLKCWNIHYYIK